jgi:hypothetical protein
MGALGATPQGQRNAYDIAQTTAGLIPGVNNAISGNQAYRDWNQGNYAGAVLNAVGAVVPPIPGASTGERTLAGILAKEVEPIGGRVMMEGGTPGLLAYHGSRHDFPSFDINQIGQGEGAQVYGHGLYFAEHPEVAEGYRTAGSDQSMQLIDSQGNAINRADLDPAGRVAHNFASSYDNFGQASTQLRYLAKGSEYTDSTKQIFLDAADNIDEWDKQGYVAKPPAEGYKYQVAIPHDPDTFFDLDSKFGDQHPDVQKAANQIFGRKFQKDMSGNDVYDFLTESVEKNHNLPDFSSESDSHVMLANELNKRGIPGIRYLDEGSRDEQFPFDGNLRLSDHPQKVQDKIAKLVPNADPNDLMLDVHDKLYKNMMDEQGDNIDWSHNFSGDASKAIMKTGVPSYTAPTTRNYVTFSDKNINILKKWGAGGALVGGTMAAGPSSAQDFYRNHPDLERHSLTEAPDGGQ